MKYRLNPLPVKTTNNFHMNELFLEFDIPSFHMNHELEISGDVASIDIKKEIVKRTCSSRIGLTFPEYCDIHITIPKGVVVSKPIFLTYHFFKDDVFVSNFHFHYEEDSSCNFIIMMTSEDNDSHFSHVTEEVISSTNSSGNITFLNLLNSKSISFYALENKVFENASITHNIVDLGGNTRVYNAYSELLEQHSLNTLNTFYLGKEKDLLDFNYYLKNIGKESNNQMKVEGVLKDFSQKNFRGTIDFIKGCNHSIGEENENCVLLSDTCRSRSLPQLLCEEEDVVGAHGVSSGKVSQEMVFYMMSRGFTKKEAEKLIVFGNVSSLIREIPNLEIQEMILQKIEELLQ